MMRPLKSWTFENYPLPLLIRHVFLKIHSKVSRTFKTARWSQSAEWIDLEVCVWYELNQWRSTQWSCPLFQSRLERKDRIFDEMIARCWYTSSFSSFENVLAALEVDVLLVLSLCDSFAVFLKIEKSKRKHPSVIVAWNEILCRPRCPFLPSPPFSFPDRRPPLSLPCPTAFFIYCLPWSLPGPVHPVLADMLTFDSFLRIARVCFGRRSRGMYFFPL